MGKKKTDITPEPLFWLRLGENDEKREKHRTGWWQGKTKVSRVGLGGGKKKV